jgi:hypothetical protein
MNRDDCSKLIEQYRDGSLAAADAPALLAAIRSADGDWILGQLALMNHIDHAFDQVSTDAFVASLFERMDADRSATRFVRDLAKRQLDKKQKSSLRLRQAKVSRPRFGVAKSAFWLSAAACLVIGIFWTNRISSTQAPFEVARVMRAQAAVIHHGGEITPARAADIVYSGDRLVTNVGGRAHVRYADNSLLEMSGDAQARIAGDGKSKSVTLDSGDIYLTAAHQLPDTSWTIRTRNGIVTVVGTELEVSSTAAYTRVRVVKGSVEFENGVNKISVAAGQEGRASAGIQISEAAPADISAIAQWRNHSVPQPLTTVTGLVDNGLVGYWNMDETSGATAADSSGGGHDCSLAKGTWVAGKLNNGLRLAGESAFAGNRKFPVPKHELTVAAWVFHDALPDMTQSYIILGNSIAWIRHEEGKPGRLDFILRAADGLQHLRVAGALTESTWHHVAGTWDGSTQRLYLDGVLEDYQVLIPRQHQDKGISIGKSAMMDVIFDEVRVYNRALSAAEIAVLAR